MYIEMHLRTLDDCMDAGVRATQEAKAETHLFPYDINSEN